MPGKKTLLLCGATGFIGRNLLELFQEEDGFEIRAVFNRREPPEAFRDDERVQWVKADLTRPEDVERVVRGADIILQAAATTSGAKEIVSRPFLHVTDNAVMNSLLLRAAHESGVGHFVFFSCSVMYSGRSPEAVKETDVDFNLTDKYFGAGWTKVYLEKMCEFYSRIGSTKFTVIRHSNVYGPHDKFDLERSHVFGATVTKVMMTPNGGKIIVWGEGSEERDLLYVEDLVEFVDRTLTHQKTRFELVNVGWGESVSVRQLVEKIVEHSGKNLTIEFDRTQPTIPFRLKLNIDRARQLYQWSPRVGLDAGIDRTLDWWRVHHAALAHKGALK